MARWVCEAEFTVIVEFLVVWAVYPIGTGTAVYTFQKVASVFTAEYSDNKNEDFVIGNKPSYEERYIEEVFDFAEFIYGGEEFSEETVEREFGLEINF